MNTKTKILISVSVLLIILLFGILGFFLYSQQQQIKNLAVLVNGKSSIAEDVLSDEVKKLVEDTTKSIDVANREQQRKQMIEETKSVSGSVKSVSGDEFVIEVWPMVSQFAEGEAAAKEAKDYTVKKDAKTEMSKDIKVGDAVVAYSDSPVLSVTSFTATKIEKVSEAFKKETSSVDPSTILEK